MCGTTDKKKSHQTKKFNKNVKKTYRAQFTKIKWALGRRHCHS